MFFLLKNRLAIFSSRKQMKCLIVIKIIDIVNGRERKVRQFMT